MTEYFQITPLINPLFLFLAVLSFGLVLIILLAGVILLVLVVY